MIAKDKSAMRFTILLLALLLFSLISLVIAAAHGDDEDSEIDKLDKLGEGTNFEEPAMALKHRALWVLAGAGALALALTFIAILLKKKNGVLRWILFLGIAVPVLLATFYAAFVTVSLNLQSATGGPVHWHADFEIWKCGEKIDLIDPTGLSNRVGSPVFHEHGDGRIHVEGVVVELEHVALHHFFEFVGGKLSDSMMLVPTNGKPGVVSASNGEFCDGQDGKSGVLQAFVLRVSNPWEHDNWIYTQEKIGDFEDFVIAPYGTVPPGDCVIIEFDAGKEHTDKLCSSYKSAIEGGELRGG